MSNRRPIVQKCTKRREEDDEESLEIFIFLLFYRRHANSRPIPRGPVLYRRRWDTAYFLDLAVSEGTFLQ